MKLDGFHGGAGLVGLAAELGAYAVESNDSATAADADSKNSSVPRYRASAESARFSRYLAAQLYGEAADYGYVYGDSGGGIASATCLTRSDAWDGAVPTLDRAELSASPARTFMRCSAYSLVILRAAAPPRWGELALSHIFAEPQDRCA
jgi:hypothetical protein